MKKFYSVVVCVFVINTIYAQTPSSCTVPQLLFNVYERDIKDLAIRRMYSVHHADTSQIRIPRVHIDSVAEGMAAIFNAVSIPERDSVFNMYCVHDNTTSYDIYPGLLVKVDTNYVWTHAWRNLITLTGNGFIDSLMNEYHYSVAQFFHWIIGEYALLHTDSLWNIYAMIDTLRTEPGVIGAEPDAIFGLAGKMDYTANGTEKYYHFYFEFNDCFDGCDNYRNWHFRVNTDCSVDYLGFTDWGVFGISPLPAPVNCNTFSGMQSYLIDDNFSVYPNPVQDRLTIQAKNFLGNSSLKIFDAAGRIISNQKMLSSKQVLDFGWVKNGIYLLEVKGNDYKGYCKIVKE